ncbi:MAG: hypothetical protein NC485_14125 [Ruminococcus flavefaciens]|nr:hypothetical protein [Ruminococcus flavefaciens]
MDEHLNLTESILKKEKFRPPMYSGDKDKIIDEVAGKEKSISDYPKIVKDLLNHIQNVDYSLRDNVISDNNRAILLMLINNVAADNYMVMAICFSKSKSSLDVNFFGSSESDKVQKYVRGKVLSEGCMNQITAECHRKTCEYALDGYELFFVGEDESVHKKVADLKEAVHLAVDVFDKAEELHMEIETFDIKGKKHTAISNDDLRELWGKNYEKNYDYLAMMNIPFIDDSEGTTRRGYRHKMFENNEKTSDKRYFAIETEKLAKLRERAGLC